ncbi:uncharacterized protein [Dermacentor albipictus]|uniref:uncharacterized protein isoform X6 n=1 Tax=Dermacentor albipictus TaxID=60249 RepID=UPI0031FCB702
MIRYTRNCSGATSHLLLQLANAPSAPPKPMEHRGLPAVKLPLRKVPSHIRDAATTVTSVTIRLIIALHALGASTERVTSTNICVLTQHK